MNDTPNQKPIGPSAEALMAYCAKTYRHWDGLSAVQKIIYSDNERESIAAAYAIDLAPIIAERDRLKAALIAMRLQALQSNDLTATEWGQEAIDLANGAIGDYPKTLAALEPKP